MFDVTIVLCSFFFVLVNVAILVCVPRKSCQDWTPYVNGGSSICLGWKMNKHNDYAKTVQVYSWVTSQNMHVRAAASAQRPVFFLP